MLSTHVFYGNNIVCYIWRFSGCCFKGRFLSWNQDYQFECDTYRCFQKGACQDDACENFNVNKVKDGKLFLSYSHKLTLMQYSTFTSHVSLSFQDVWSAINALMTVHLSLKKMFVRPSNVKQENTKWSKKVKTCWQLPIKILFILSYLLILSTSKHLKLHNG